MEYHKLVERVQGLSDLELATLICLIAKQPCSIEVADNLVDDLAHELALVCLNWEAVIAWLIIRR